MSAPSGEAALLAGVEAALAAPGDPPARLLAVCRLLAEGVPHYHWVGFYVVPRGADRVLALGPYVGAPTEHTRIPFGRGICGQVAEREETLVVPDVSAEANYLACSLEVRSEIVVPIFAAGRFVAQLDIDSHERDPFGEADRWLLEAVCAKVAPAVEALREGPWLDAPGGGR